MKSLACARVGIVAVAVLLLSFAGPLGCGEDPMDPNTQEDAGVTGEEDASIDPGADAGPEQPDAGSDELLDCEPYTDSGEADEYSDIAGLRDLALKAALLKRVDNHRSVGYDSAKSRLFGSSGIDVRGGKIECIYTGLRFDPSQLDKGGGFNTEHSWPQSQFGNDSNAAKGDMHHLFPTERDANSRRSSMDFGNTDCSASACVWSQGGSECGPAIGSDKRVFEVRPVYRGDIARAHFYFSIRYQSFINATEEATLRRWHRCDPPDDIERARNNKIARVQDNRNPFIDRPEFVDAIADF